MPGHWAAVSSTRRVEPEGQEADWRFAVVSALTLNLILLLFSYLHLIHLHVGVWHSCRRGGFCIFGRKCPSTGSVTCYVVVPGAVKWGAVGVSEQMQTQAFVLWGGSNTEH